MNKTDKQVIEVAEFSDLTDILTLQKDCYQEEAEIYQDYSIPPLTQTLVSIEKDYDHLVFLKYTNQGKIIGSVRAKLIEQTCEIGRLIVDQNHRRKGIGKQLMEAIEAHFNQVKRYELFTGHLSQRNLSFYQKLGYLQFRSEVVNSKLNLVFLEKFSS